MDIPSAVRPEIRVVEAPGESSDLDAARELLEHPERFDTAARLLKLAIDQSLDAEDLLQGTFAGEVDWPWPTLTELVGPVLAGDLIFVPARPGCGKTTFLMNALRHWIKRNHRTLYIGMEMPPARLRLQWAALETNLDFRYVARKRWDLLPKDAVSRLKVHLAWQSSAEVQPFVTFADDDRLTMGSLRRWIEFAHGEGLETVVVDHLHRMDWGSGSDLTSRMAEGVRQLKTLAKDYNVRMVVAAQLKRRQGHSILEDYFPPSASEIQQTGATEQEADTILLLHRSLKSGLARGDLAKIEKGQKDLRDVVEDRVMRVRVGKCRLDGDVRDQDLKLYLNKGTLYTTEVERATATFEERYDQCS